MEYSCDSQTEANIDSLLVFVHPGELSQPVEESFMSCIATSENIGELRLIRLGVVSTRSRLRQPEDNQEQRISGRKVTKS